MREIDGILFANDGDWVESLTALAEHADGRLEIIDWAARMRLGSADRVPAAEPQNLADLEGVAARAT